MLGADPLINNPVTRPECEGSHSHYAFADSELSGMQQTFTEGRRTLGQVLCKRRVVYCSQSSLQAQAVTDSSDLSKSRLLGGTSKLSSVSVCKQMTVLVSPEIMVKLLRCYIVPNQAI